MFLLLSTNKNATFLSTVSFRNDTIEIQGVSRQTVRSNSFLMNKNIKLLNLGYEVIKTTLKPNLKIRVFEFLAAYDKIVWHPYCE